MEIGAQAGDHGRAVEIEAAIILPELFTHRLGQSREMFRWRSLVDEALMAGYRFHGRHYSECSVVSRGSRSALAA